MVNMSSHETLVVVLDVVMDPHNWHMNSCIHICIHLDSYLIIVYILTCIYAIIE